MERNDIIRKVAEAFYLKRMQEDLTGSADGDWRWAEVCVDFFDDPEPIRTDFWISQEKDYDWIEPLYKNLKEGAKV